jgi:hypothetical protein
MQDKFGVELGVGDTIIYITRRSSYVSVHKAVVTSIEKVPSPWGGDRYNHKIKIFREYSPAEIEQDEWSENYYTEKYGERDKWPKWASRKRSKERTLTSPTFVIIQKGDTLTNEGGSS